jgi:nitrite reductase/ring-hydroxylating ferredoxin subunit
MTTYTLCQLDDIPDNSSKGFALDKKQNEASIFVVRQQDTIYVYRNHCPHLGLPLEWMPHQFLDRDGHYIQCATHGALFRIRDGYCISGPCPGESLGALPFRIEGKSIIIDSSFLDADP